MDRLAVFFAAIVPGLLLLAYGVAITRSSWSNEALWTAFFMGGVGVIAALPLELTLQKVIVIGALAPLLQAAVTAVLIAAIPEEMVKFVILLGVAERHVDARRRQDIVVLALAVSLGFATVENLFYVAVPEDWQFIAAVRALAAVPGHGINGLAMGALVLSARVHPGNQGVKLFLALLVPVVLHAAYDFPLIALKDGLKPEWLIMVWLAILVASAVIAIGLCKRILPAAVEADRLSGRDPRPDGPALPVVIAGWGLLVASLVLAIIMFWMKSTPQPWLGATLSVLPAALAIDLIWTGLRRRRAVSRQGGEKPP
jgi:RsiW-degrading membrane proteinase PrsW (M82 family)